MLESSDVGTLFATMQANYGFRWPHKADAIPVWQHKLRRFSKQQILDAADRAMDAYKDHPPSAGEFADVVRSLVPALPNPDSDCRLDSDTIAAYAKPESKINPKGNPHGISLLDSVAQRRPGESVEDQRRRVSDAMTFAKYPHLRFDGRSAR